MTELKLTEDQEEERLFHERVAATKLLLGGLTSSMQANVIGLALGANVMTKEELRRLDVSLSRVDGSIDKLVAGLRPEHGNFPLGRLAGERLYMAAEEAKTVLGQSGVLLFRYTERK